LDLIHKLRSGDLSGINKIGDNYINEDNRSDLEKLYKAKRRIFVQDKNNSYSFNENQDKVRIDRNDEDIKSYKYVYQRGRRSKPQSQEGGRVNIDSCIEVLLSDLAGNIISVEERNEVIKHTLSADIRSLYKYNQDQLFGLIEDLMCFYDKKNSKDSEKKSEEDLQCDIEYGDRIRNGREWATEPVILALAEALSIQINIHCRLPNYQDINRYNEGCRFICNIVHLPGHYQSFNENGVDGKEVMNKVGDCAFEPILHQLYLLRENNQYPKSLGINFDGANYEGGARSSGYKHNDNVRILRVLAAERYKENMKKIFDAHEQGIEEGLEDRHVPKSNGNEVEQTGQEKRPDFPRKILEKPEVITKRPLHNFPNFF
jgi:hypothetical protein